MQDGAVAGQVVTELKLQVDERGGGLGVEAPALLLAVRAVGVPGAGEPPLHLALGNASVKAANLPLTATMIPGLQCRSASRRWGTLR